MSCRSFLGESRDLWSDKKMENILTLEKSALVFVSVRERRGMTEKKRKLVTLITIKSSKCFTENVGLTSC